MVYCPKCGSKAEFDVEIGGASCPLCKRRYLIRFEGERA